MNPEHKFALIALGIVLLIGVIGFLPTLIIVLIICGFRCWCYCFRVTPSISTFFLEGCFLDNFDSFKSRHVVSPEERPSNEDGWTHLLRIRGLSNRRKHTFIVEPSHNIEHQFGHYCDDIYISYRKLNVVHIERNAIVYDGPAFIEVNVDTSTRPVHFVDFNWTVYKHSWLLHNHICVIMGILQNNRSLKSEKILALRIEFN